MKESEGVVLFGWVKFIMEGVVVFVIVVGEFDG